MKNKRGEIKNLSVKVLWGIVIAVALFIVIYSAVQLFSGDVDLVTATENSVNVVSAFTMKVAYPLFGAILGFKANEFDFLKFLAFILLTIIIVSTMDSVNLFDGGSGSKSGEWINFSVGIIVGIIGVRFMPDNLWSSLTAPSSALIATILIGLPFLAMFFITMKIKRPLVVKLVWLLYLVFVVYLITSGDIEKEIKLVYLIFAILAVVMLFAEGFIRVLWLKQSSVSALQDTLGLRNSERLAKLEGRINDLTDTIDKTRSVNLKKDLNKLKGELIEEYKEISGDKFYNP